MPTLGAAATGGLDPVGGALEGGAHPLPAAGPVQLAPLPSLLMLHPGVIRGHLDQRVRDAHADQVGRGLDPIDDRSSRQVRRMDGRLLVSKLIGGLVANDTMQG